MRLSAALAAAAGSLLISSGAWAQPPAKPAAARDSAPASMQIQNGPLQTVHYFSAKGMSANDVAALHDRERTENEISLSHQLAALRVQYVANERALESKRFEAQQQLLNAATNFFPGIYPDEVPAVTVYGALAFAGVPFGPGYYGPGRLGYPLYGYGYNIPAYLGTPTAPAGLSPSAATALSLGIDEGQIKRELVRGLADQAKPEYVASLRQLAGQPVAQAGQTGGARPAGFKENTASVTVTLKNGTKVEGRLVKEDADWLTLDTTAGQTRIRKSEVVSVTTPKAGAAPKKESDQ
jgi:hypothetical protein